MDAYRIDGPATINFSGGRSSAYMLRRILDAHGGTLPDDVVPVFTNTGRERPETLDFVQRVATEWGVRIRWLEYRYRPEAGGGIRDPKNTWVEVSHNSASRDGRPFEELIRSRDYVPNRTQRICTRELKVLTIRRFCRQALGWRRWRFTLGIRYDERRRWGRILMTECDAIMPMVEAEATHGDVRRFWKRAPFDLEIPSSRGNCDLCFLKGARNLVETIREDPSLADWWLDMERTTQTRSRERGRKVRQEGDCLFRRDPPFSELVEMAKRPPDPSLLDAFSDEELDDCNCTD